MRKPIGGGARGREGEAGWGAMPPLTPPLFAIL